MQLVNAFGRKALPCVHQAVGEVSVELESVLAVEDEQRIFGDRIIDAVFDKVEKEHQDLRERSVRLASKVFIIKRTAYSSVQ